MSCLAECEQDFPDNDFVHSVPESACRELTFKQTHKLSPDAVALIVKMSAEGYSDKGISAELEARFGIHVHRNSLGYYRRKHAPQVAQASTVALNAAREESSLATLAGRLMRVEKLFEAEKRKGKRANLVVMARLLSIADLMVSRVQDRELRSKALAGR